MINWSGKRRWIALVLLIAGIVVMINIPPVIPVIQLPGEVYPEGWSIFGLRITNTLMGSVLAWIVLALLMFYVHRNRPQRGTEVPRGGFYNFFEMIYEGLYNFIRPIAGEKYLRYIFSFFMTIFMIVLFSNWQSLLPGVDSIGFLHEHVKVNKETGEQEFEAGYETYRGFLGFTMLNGKCPWVSPEEAATYTDEQKAARAAAGCITGTGAPVPASEEAHGEDASAESHEAEAPAAEVAAAGEAEAPASEAGEAEHAEGEAAAAAKEGGHHATPGDPNVPWVITPFLRPPSTDLNMTIALALIAVVMVQVLGFRALGIGYLTKFFNFKTLFTSPLGGIDVAVGLLELIGEFAKILSFSFRLLGNIFAGSILLFVMSFLIPFLPWPFFILEFFVGIIQALVFGLLTAIFMAQATASHGHDEHESHEAPEVAH